MPDVVLYLLKRWKENANILEMPKRRRFFAEIFPQVKRGDGGYRCGAGI